MFAVGIQNSVWLLRPEVGVPAWTGNGRKPFKERVLDESARPVRIPALVASGPDIRWQRLQVAAGEKGARIYDWACQRVVENQDQMPGRDSWLLVRRSLTKPYECAYFLSNAPPDTALLTLAQVASTR